MPHDTPDEDEIEDAQTDEGTEPEADTDTISRDVIETLDTQGELAKRFESPESETDESHHQGGSDDE